MEEDKFEAPIQSAVYGFMVVLISYFIFSFAWYFNSITLAIAMLSASVFSLPMIMDKKTDMITACVSSINAVLRNKSAMFFWSVIIVFFTSIGIMSAFLGFIVIVPLLGYSTWHGYRECLDVSAWDDRLEEFSVNPVSSSAKEN